MSAAVGTTLSALADGTRRSVVEALSGGPLTAGELAARLEVTPAALTRHLRSLRRAGLVSVSIGQEDNRRHVYATRPGPLQELNDWAEAVARFWTSQLTSYADHVRER